MFRINDNPQTINKYQASSRTVKFKPMYKRSAATELSSREPLDQQMLISSKTTQVSQTFVTVFLTKL